jgi:hypothetical protein
MKSPSCPKRAKLAVRKSRCRKHHPPRFLQDHVREASPIPMPDLPEDILFKHRYPVRLQHRRAILCGLVLKVESVKRFRQPGNSRFDSTSLPVRRTVADLCQTSSFETGG